MVVEVVGHRLEVEGVEVGVGEVAAPERERDVARVERYRSRELRVEILLKGVRLVPIDLARALPRGIKIDIAQQATTYIETV